MALLCSPPDRWSARRRSSWRRRLRPARRPVKRRWRGCAQRRRSTSRANAKMRSRSIRRCSRARTFTIRKTRRNRACASLITLRPNRKNRTMKTNELGLLCCQTALQGVGAFMVAQPRVRAGVHDVDESHLVARATSADVTRPRRLLLCLDGVPFEIMQAAQGRGLFAGFNEPARLLSPFPTMTNIALATMLKASAPLGYETVYFDRQMQEQRGSIGKYIGRRTPDKVPSSYMDELDYQEPLPFEFLVYVAPDAVWRADMRRFRERFRAAPRERDYFGFLKGTDGLLHIRGPAKLQPALESLDEILRELQAWCGRETEIVLFSDHGMNLAEVRKIHLLTHLREQGYEVKSEFRGHGPRSVSVPAFGLIGFAALYCAAETDPAELAATLAALEGVDFSL